MNPKAHGRSQAALIKKMSRLATSSPRTISPQMQIQSSMAKQSELEVHTTLSIFRDTSVETSDGN